MARSSGEPRGDSLVPTGCVAVGSDDQENNKCRRAEASRGFQGRSAVRGEGDEVSAHRDLDCPLSCLLTPAGPSGGDLAPSAPSRR